MVTHGTALRTPSIMREFHSAVLAQLPDLTDEEMQRWNRHKRELGWLLREVFRNTSTFRVPNFGLTDLEGEAKRLIAGSPLPLTAEDLAQRATDAYPALKHRSNASSVLNSLARKGHVKKASVKGEVYFGRTDEY